jgi:hypothetical protein
MALTQTIVIVEQTKNGCVYGVFCNDPHLDIDSGTVKSGKLPESVKVEYVKPDTMQECGCCSCYHRPEFYGDCRDDNERFVNNT